MRRTLSCAALSCAVGLINAKALRRSDNSARWIPAEETQLGFMNPLYGPPMPTAAPEVSHTVTALEARGTDDNTCGYVSNVPASSLWCATTASCSYNTIYSNMGCCVGTACLFATRCYDRTDSLSFTTNNGRTLYCDEEEYPYCTTLIYRDSIFTGYTLLHCGKRTGTGDIYFTLNTASRTSTASDIDSTTDDISSTSTTSESSTGFTSTLPTSGLFSPSGTTPSSSASSTADPDDDNDPPVGAIVGGVVGGVAAIGLVLLGVWAVMRQRNKLKNAVATYQPSGPGGGDGGPPQYTPHMSQMSSQPYPGMSGVVAAAAAAGGGGGGGGGGFDPRASMVKPNSGSPHTASYGPSYDQTSIAVSAVPHGSPPPPSALASSGAYTGTPSPPPQGQQQQQQQGYGNVPPSGPPATTQAGEFIPGHHPSYHGVYAVNQSGPVELPLVRGDGELRELQG
ncbi:hypothetical protein VTH82DRAFT_5002 [Thermothelomyces myriococcoides]